jgi:hypothetical protein
MDNRVTRIEHLASSYLPYSASVSSLIPGGLQGNDCLIRQEMTTSSTPTCVTHHLSARISQVMLVQAPLRLYELEAWIFDFPRQHVSPCWLPRYGYVITNVYE